MLRYIALKMVVGNLPMCHFKVARQTGWVLCRMIRASLCTHKHLLRPLRAESIKYILLSSPKLKVVFFKRLSDRKVVMLPSRAQSVQVIDIMCHTRTLLKFGRNSGFVKYCTEPDKCHPNLNFLLVSFSLFSRCFSWHKMCSYLENWRTFKPFPLYTIVSRSEILFSGISAVN